MPNCSPTRRAAARAGVKLLPLLAAAMAWTVACSHDAASPVAPPPSHQTVARVVISPDAVTLQLSLTVQLRAIVTDSSGETLARPVSWSSANPQVAVVDSNGLVWSRHTGRTTVTATSDGKSGSADITVTDSTGLAYVSVSSPHEDLIVGSSITLTAVARDAAGDSLPGYVMTWASADTSIATVDSVTGKVTGVSLGSALITAATSGANGGAYVSVITIAPGVTETDLGDLGGGSAFAYGVNDSGSVVGASSTASGQVHAFLWTAASGMTDLGTLGGSASSARAINDSGIVVGQSTTAAGAWHAFRWTRTGGMQDLGDPASGTPSSASSVSQGGWIAGTVGSHAAAWSPSGALTDLGNYVWAYESFATGINDAGRVSGGVSYPECGYSSCDDGIMAYGWTLGVGGSDLGFGSNAAAEGINGRGDIVGYSSGSGFLLLNDGARQVLATPSPGQSIADAVNEADQVAGSASGASWVTHPALWLRPDSLRLLSIATGWATAINDARQVVGATQNASTPRAKMWTLTGASPARLRPSVAAVRQRAGVHP